MKCCLYRVKLQTNVRLLKFRTSNLSSTTSFFSARRFDKLCRSRDLKHVIFRCFLLVLIFKCINDQELNLSFKYANIHAISPMIYIFLYTTDIFRTKNDIPRICQEHECITFYDAVNMIHDVITTAKPFPLRLGQTGKRIYYGGKTDKTCRIWLSGDKIHLL